jgi:DNA-binding NarL/FixJ family response regulator
VIRVFIADDQALVRQGLRALLEMEPEVEIVGEAARGDEALARLKAVDADVVLLDVRMPGMSDIEVLRELNNFRSAARERRFESGGGAVPNVLMLTTFDDADAVLEAIRAGARGFMLKDVSFEQLISAIRAIHSGATVFQPAMTQRLVERVRRMATTAALVELTEREIEVVRLMAGGYSNGEIAHALGVAEGTIKNHVSNILSKFAARDRTRAVLKALEAGLL